LNKTNLISLINQGDIEKYGTGFRRISEWLKGEPHLDITIKDFTDHFQATIYEKNNEKVGEKVGEKLSENQKLIIKYMIQNPRISARELAEKLGISTRKTEENIAKLKKKGVIKRIDPAKGGHWKVN